MTAGGIKVLQTCIKSDVYTRPRNIHLYIQIKLVYTKIIQQCKLKWSMDIGRELAKYTHKYKWIKE
jgi:hypothetical protein